MVLVKNSISLIRQAGVLSLLIPVLLLFSSNSLAEAKRIYSIGIVPQFESRHLHAIWKPIIRRLENKTGLDFRLQGSPSIAIFEKQLMKGEFDFAYMNPYQLLQTQKKTAYRPLFRDHGRQLYGVLVVRKDSGINNIQQLNHQNIAFPSPNALGASLLLRAELRQKHHINIIPRYVNNHDSVYLNTYLKQTLAGGGVQKTLDQQKPVIRQQLKVLFKTRKLAPHPFAVHPRVDRKIAARVLNAFLDMAKDPNDKTMLSKIPIKQIGIASLQDYADLEQLHLETLGPEK